jgi:hypothetical protein
MAIRDQQNQQDRKITDDFDILACFLDGVMI